MSKPLQEKRFDYKGYPCVVLFMPYGYRCGYVGLPEQNKYYKKDYDFIPIDCHCGLTYAKSYLHGQEDKNKWWIGFDCGHVCDGYDVPKAKEYFSDDKSVMEIIKLQEITGYYAVCNKEAEIRTLEYCIEQCKKIVDQLEGQQ